MIVHSAICKRERLSLLRVSINTPNHWPLISLPASANRTTMIRMPMPQSPIGAITPKVRRPTPNAIDPQKTTIPSRTSQNATYSLPLGTPEASSAMIWEVTTPPGGGGPPGGQITPAGTTVESPSPLAVPIVGHDIFPLRGIRAGDDGHHRLGIAQVEHLVGHAGFDEDEVAGLVLHRLLEPGAVLVAHAALEDVEHQLEVDVDVGVGHAARRDGGDVHRQLPGIDVLGREAGLVLDAVPAAAGPAATDDGDAVVALD